MKKLRGASFGVITALVIAIAAALASAGVFDADAAPAQVEATP
ncbi:hypothetical protein [Marinicauda salina]|nr:hypothetical protein [Marinicauda salina]